MRNIVIDTISFFVTLRCNLKCADCCTRASYEINPAHFPLENLKFALSRLFETVSFIRKFSFTGGEPFLRKDMGELISAVLSFKDQFEVFEIVTNGTILPDDKIIDIISGHKDKMYIMIDRYGDLSINADRLLASLQTKGIACHIREYGAGGPYSGGWVSLGDIELKHDEKQTAELFKSCNIVNKRKNNTAIIAEDSPSGELNIVYCTLCNGELHYCGRAAATVRTLKSSEFEKDFVNMIDVSSGVDETRNKIIEMFSGNIPLACAYCNGETETSPRITPAIQLKG